jgi:hypothetical protein
MVFKLLERVGAFEDTVYNRMTKFEWDPRKARLEVHLDQNTNGRNFGELIRGKYATTQVDFQQLTGVHR